MWAQPTVTALFVVFFRAPAIAYPAISSTDRHPDDRPPLPRRRLSVRLPRRRLRGDEQPAPGVLLATPPTGLAGRIPGAGPPALISSYISRRVALI